MNCVKQSYVYGHCLRIKHRFKEKKSNGDTKQIFSNHARMPPVISTHFLHVNDITVYEYTHEESTSAYSAAQSGNFL